MANSRARCSASSAPSSVISRSMTVSHAPRVSHAAQSSACTREWRRRTVTRWSGHCFRRAYIATVIEVQEPSEAKSRSYGVGPVSVPPARAGSSLRKRCEPATISWAKPSPVPRTITTPSAGRSLFMTFAFLPVSRDAGLRYGVARRRRRSDSTGRGSTMANTLRRRCPERVVRFMCPRRRVPPLLIPRQHCIHPGDEPSELLDVLPEEWLGGLVGDAPIVGDQATFEMKTRTPALARSIKICPSVSAIRPGAP